MMFMLDEGPDVPELVAAGAPWDNEAGILQGTELVTDMCYEWQVGACVCVCAGMCVQACVCEPLYVCGRVCSIGSRCVRVDVWSCCRPNKEGAVSLGRRM